MTSARDLTHYRIAAVQMDIVPGESAINCRHATELAREAIGRGARLIAFPELSDIDMVVDASARATSAHGPFTEPLERLTREHGVHVVVGMSRRDGGGLYNSAVFIGPQGILGAYDKVHLWAGTWEPKSDCWSEDPRRIEPHNYLPGAGFKTFEVDGISVGSMICYDGLFPESWLCNRLLGADLIVWPTNRGSYSDVDVPALARFFQVIVVAVNRFGQSSYWTRGDSHIVDAQGHILAHAYNGEAVLIADLNIEADRRWRRSLPQQRDRRPELYGRVAQASPEAEVALGIPSCHVAPLWMEQRG